MATAEATKLKNVRIPFLKFILKDLLGLDVFAAHHTNRLTASRIVFYKTSPVLMIKDQQMRIYEFENYRAVISHFIRDNESTRGYQGQLAKAAGCHRSYLSHVLNRSVQLTLDQGAGLCRFWALSELESNFFLDLIALERAGTAPLRELIQRRLNRCRSRLREQDKNISVRVGAERMASPNFESEYYSAWFWRAIHMATGIAQYRQPRAIAERLRLPVDLVEKVLARLEQEGLVERGKQKDWRRSKDNLHLPKNSPFNSLSHMIWRQKAFEDAQRMRPGSLHFSALYTMSRKDAERLQESLLGSIENSRKEILLSKDEELFCFNCDFFEL